MMAHRLYVVEFCADCPNCYYNDFTLTHHCVVAGNATIPDVDAVPKWKWCPLPKNQEGA